MRRIILDTDVASLSIKQTLPACCLVYELPLATLNIKDFEDLVEYEGLSLIRPHDG